MSAPYLAVIAARYRMLLQYRAAALAAVATQLFWGALKVMVLAAFYSVATSAPPMSFEQVAGYVWLGQAMLGLLPWNVDDELAQQIRSGAVAFDLLRPLDLYAFWFARTFAFRTARTTLRAIPLVAVAAVLLPLCGLARWGLAPPPSVTAGLLFALSLAATVLLSTAITMLLHVNMLFALSSAAATQVMPGVVILFSGMIVPLPLFPQWLQPALRLQPFRGLADVPFRIYSGNIAPSAALLEIALQLGWTLALVALGRALLALAARRVVIQGG